MKNYFRFLSQEQQEILNKIRFLPDFYLKESDLVLDIQLALDERYEILSLPTTPIPTNHQIEAFLKMKSNLKRGDCFGAQFIEQGLGKSKIALMWASYLYAHGYIDRVVIIAPNDLKHQWADEQIPLHYAGTNIVSIVWDGFGSQKKRNDFVDILNHPGIKFFCINVEAFSSDSIKQYVHMFTKSAKDILVIVDESSTIKNGRRKPKGPRTKRRGAKRTNLILDGFRNRDHKMILTGTATPNRPFDLWAQFEFLKSNYLGLDFWDFCKRYGEMMQVKRANAKRMSLELLDAKTFRLVKSDLRRLAPVSVAPDASMKVFSDKKPVLTPSQVEAIAMNRGITESGVIRISQMDKLEQFRNLDELRAKIEPVTFFCKTTEVIDLPEQVYVPIECEMTKDQKKLYNDMAKDMIVSYEGDTLSTTFKQVMYIRCQQIAGGLFPTPIHIIKEGLEHGDERIVTKYTTKPLPSCGKLEKLSAVLDDIDPDQSKIYWSWFVGEQNLIYKMLCEKYGSEYVGLYRDNKPEVVRAFKAGEIKHFVSGDAGSFGLNLQVAYLQFFYSNSHRADIRDQKEKRSHRIGQTNTVVYQDLICKGTKDQAILDALQRKMNLIDYFRRYDVD